MIVFAARLMGTLFGRQIVLSVHKKNSYGELARRLIQSKYSYQTKIQKKKISVIGTLTN